MKIEYNERYIKNVKYKGGNEFWSVKNANQKN